jgi:hypothetical protein
MPASSFSAINSWGVYLFAAFAIVALFVPTLSATSQYSREGADWRSVDGVRAVLDGLRPGVEVSLTFGTSSAADPLHLYGHKIECSYGRGNLSEQSLWLLPDVTLAPTVQYELRLSGDEVQVASPV